MSDKHPKPTNAGSSIIPSKNSIYVHIEESTPKTRAYVLSNGNIFAIKVKDREYTLEFEDGLLYEVVSKLDDQSGQYSYYNEEFVQIEWERTGVVFTADELNNLIKEETKNEN
jgi:hypothetical protein